jgi:hypothetical protein
MSYTVQNPNVFTAAFSGALAGMGVSGRIVISANPTRYAGLIAIANAFAQQLDTLWGATPVGFLEVQAFQEATEALWQQRSPIPNTATLAPSTWEDECLALITIVQAAVAFYLTQGYTNPPIGGGGSDDHKVMVSVTDTTPDYLAAKLLFASGLTATIENPGADEAIQIEATYDDSLAPQLGTSLTQDAITALKGPTPSGLQQVFVNKGGSDITGNGTRYKPYASIASALTAIALLADNTSTHRYAIMAGPGNFAEALVLEPWVYIVGTHQNTTRITAPTITFSANWTPAGDHRAGFNNVTMAGGPYTFDFNTVSSNEGKLTFQNVTWNTKPVFLAFSAINQVSMQNCYLLGGHAQTGINFTALQTSYQNGASIDLTSVNDGRNLPTIFSAYGGGTDGPLNATWTVSGGSNAVTVALYGFPIGGLVTLDGLQATIIGEPECMTNGATLLNSAPLPKMALWQDAVTGFVYIGGQRTQDHGSNAGVQLQSNQTNRAQYRASQYGANNFSPGLSAFKSRGAAFPALGGVIALDPLWRMSTVGVAPDNASIPIAAFITIQVPAGFVPVAQNWVPSEYELQLVPLAGPINSRRVVFKVSSEGETETLSGIRIGGPNTTPATIATVGALARSGNGSPEGAIVGSVGDLWSQLDGGGLWYKATGTATNTGWISFSALGTQGTAVVATVIAGGGTANLGAVNVVSASGKRIIQFTCLVNPFAGIQNGFIAASAMVNGIQVWQSEVTYKVPPNNEVVMLSLTYLDNGAPGSQSVDIKFDNLNADATAQVLIQNASLVAFAG